MASYTAGLYLYLPNKKEQEGVNFHENSRKKEIEEENSSICAHTFVKEIEELCHLPTLVIASQQIKPVWSSQFTRVQKNHNLGRKTSTINIISKKEKLSRWRG